MWSSSQVYEGSPDASSKIYDRSSRLHVHERSCPRRYSIQHPAPLMPLEALQAGQTGRRTRRTWNTLEGPNTPSVRDVALEKKPLPAATTSWTWMISRKLMESL